MGELILCDRPIAANPFFIEDAALNIYSLEELSYYIANNVYLLNADFISTDLCHWIGRELGYKDLEHQLLDAMRSNVPLHIFVGQILTYSGYLTGQEIRSALEVIASFENKSEAECQKLRADRLMEKGKVVDAIYEYEHMIDEGVLNQAPANLEGDVWHNLGCAYAKLFFFPEACGCFEEAYRRNHKNQSLRSALACMECTKDEEGFQSLVQKYFVPEDVVQSVKEEVSALSGQDAIREFDHWVDTCHLEKEDGAQHREEIQTVINRWKGEYIRLCQI
jgi:tetratricopeptide (TPR) repeat protein